VTSGEWGQTVEHLVAWVGSDADASLLVLDGIGSAGREDLLDLAQAAWAEHGLSVLSGRAPMAPGDTVAAAVYDAVICSPRASVVLEDAAAADVPAGESIDLAVRTWAGLIRSAAGPRPFVLVLREVELGFEIALGFVRELARQLATGVPRGRIVVNPIGSLPSRSGDLRVLVCPPARAPQRLLGSDGVERRMHPALALALETVTRDRPVMLEVLRAWRRQGRIRLVDGLWMPGKDLGAPALSLSRPALGALRSLTGDGLTVLAVVGMLEPCRFVDVMAALAGTQLGTGRAGAEVLADLRSRGMVSEGPHGLQVTDDLVRASTVASIGAAKRELWRIRAASPGGGSPRRQRQLLDGAGLSGAAQPRDRGLPTGSEADQGGAGADCGDGEAAIEAARWALARARTADLSTVASLAAVVLARRGRVDRARTWLEQARAAATGEAGQDAAFGAAAIEAVFLGWAEGEIRRVEGKREAMAIAFDLAVQAAVAAADARLATLIGGARDDALQTLDADALPGEGPTWQDAFLPGPVGEYLTAVHHLTARLRALESGRMPPDRLPDTLKEVLAQARTRRCVMMWCRAARLARSYGQAPGRPPTGPDGVDDVQRAVLSLLAAGLSTRDCAKALSMQARAVEYRIRSLFEQTGTSSRTQLVREYVDGRAVDSSG
jgi:DNA-binding CsgD family transcriptional regulator